MDKFMILTRFACLCALISLISSQKIHMRKKPMNPTAIRMIAKLAEKKDLTAFREKFAKKFKVDKKLMDLPQVKGYLKQEFTDKNKVPDVNDSAQMFSVTVALAHMFCSYCKTSYNCPCIVRYCADKSECI